MCPFMCNVTLPLVARHIVVVCWIVALIWLDCILSLSLLYIASNTPSESIKRDWVKTFYSGHVCCGGDSKHARSFASAAWVVCNWNTRLNALVLSLALELALKDEKQPHFHQIDSMIHVALPALYNACFTQKTIALGDMYSLSDFYEQYPPLNFWIYEISVMCLYVALPHSSIARHCWVNKNYIIYIYISLTRQLPFRLLSNIITSLQQEQAHTISLSHK